MTAAVSEVGSESGCPSWGVPIRLFSCRTLWVGKREVSLSRVGRAWPKVGTDEETDAPKPRLSRNACTRPTRVGSANASRLATMSSVINPAGRDVKSKAERKDGEAFVAMSNSSFCLFDSVGSTDVDGGRLRLSEAEARTVAFRFRSSEAALSIRSPC